MKSYHMLRSNRAKYVHAPVLLYQLLYILCQSLRHTFSSTIVNLPSKPIHVTRPAALESELTSSPFSSLFTRTIHRRTQRAMHTASHPLTLLFFCLYNCISAAPIAPTKRQGSLPDVFSFNVTSSKTQRAWTSTDTTGEDDADVRCSD